MFNDDTIKIIQFMGNQLGFMFTLLVVLWALLRLMMYDIKLTENMIIEHRKLKKLIKERHISNKTNEEI